MAQKPRNTANSFLIYTEPPKAYPPRYRAIARLLGAFSFVKHDYFGAFVTLSIVLALLITKGAAREGQPGPFQWLFNGYIEETSAITTRYSQSPTHLADLSTISSVETQTFGEGGPQITIDPATSNESSFIAHNPPSTDYVALNTGKRHQITEYTVQDGDTLSFIASDFGVSMQSILWANSLRDVDSLSPGQKIKIPPVNGVIHPVKKGDTLATIAKKYGVDEAKIIEFNDLPQTGAIAIGDELIVPDGTMPRVRVSSGTVASNTQQATQTRFGYLPDLGDFFFKPTNGFNWGKIHGRNGIDVANSCGTAIYASAEGTVITADASGYNGGFGKYIKITHANGTETLYAHASKILVSLGDKVTRGQHIAAMGTTGRSTGCHLHFEVHGARNPFAKY